MLSPCLSLAQDSNVASECLGARLCRGQAAGIHLKNKAAGACVVDLVDPSIQSLRPLMSVTVRLFIAIERNY